ncbi:MAG TPA: bifunctional adenosylcobinamide kinase/adenosylcobinamide-phosphate guanylyltransferase [Steroidobacter sp.]
MKQLILGGARSGKSSLATRLALESGRNVAIIVTARATDDEMRERIEQHRRERPAHWSVLEEPEHLGEALRKLGDDSFVVVDCLTVWIAHVLFPVAPDGSARVDEPAWERERSSLLEALDRHRGELVLVSNEVGLGIVPGSAAGRRFRDEQGRLNQALAARCDRVTFLAAGFRCSSSHESRRRHDLCEQSDLAKLYARAQTIACHSAQLAFQVDTPGEKRKRREHQRGREKDTRNKQGDRPHRNHGRRSVPSESLAHAARKRRDPHRPCNGAESRPCRDQRHSRAPARRSGTRSTPLPTR